MGLYTLIVIVLEYFLFWGFCPIWFYIFCFCPMVLLSILSFLCLFMWSHDKNVDCPHLYHVITWTEMGSYTLIVGVLEYFLFWGFCPIWFYPLGLLSYGAIVHFSFSLSVYVIAWWECWLSTPVSCDHMNRNWIVHLDCWSIRIFSLLGVLSDLIFILWGFCSMVLFVHFSFSLPTYVITWQECWLFTHVPFDQKNRNRIIDLDC